METRKVTAGTEYQINSKLWKKQKKKNSFVNFFKFKSTDTHTCITVTVIRRLFSSPQQNKSVLAGVVKLKTHRKMTAMTFI